MLKVDFINVGYGDSVLLRHYNRKGGDLCMLVDTGDCNEANYLESDIRVKSIDYLVSEKVEKIDILVISHLHLDHVGGLLEITEKIPVKELWVNYKLDHEYIGKEIKCSINYTDGAKNLVRSINLYSKSISMLIAKGTLIKEIIWPYVRSFSWNFEMEILCCDSQKLVRQREIIDSLFVEGDVEQKGCSLGELDAFTNNTSIVLNICYNNVRILLGADAYISYWDSRTVPRCDILKLPHHGHRDGINKQLASQMNPRYVVISVSNTRLDDCPSKESVKTLYACANPTCIMCTDAVNMPPFFHGRRHKAISFEIDDAGQISCISQ
ncbi:MAG TPA: MBL fold metallo-hydrolase [Clostridia bacterium]|nr:MBL fold metallo-hydrolase [Clostridia bacterium]